jgi:hypothetical protein
MALPVSGSVLAGRNITMACRSRPHRFAALPADLAALTLGLGLSRSSITAKGSRWLCNRLYATNRTRALDVNMSGSRYRRLLAD